MTRRIWAFLIGEVLSLRIPKRPLHERLRDPSNLAHKRGQILSIEKISLT
jgi:hypothetical protein